MGKKKLNRREFVSVISAGAGLFALEKTGFSTNAGNSGIKTDPFQKIILGKSGITTSLLGMGTGFNAGNRSAAIIRAGKDIAVSIILSAYDKGIRYFDCADSYGTHPYIALALKGIPRENYTIGSKIWVSSGGIPEPERPDANVVVDRFRKELNTDYIDLVQIHCMTEANWTDQQKKQMDILENLKAKRVIRAHGVSVHSLRALEAAAESSWVDVIHVRINPYGEAMDHKDPEMVVPVIKKLHKAGKGVIGMKLIGNGKFRNDIEKIDTSLKFVLGLDTVDMIIIGFEQSWQIDNYASRVEKELKTKPKK
jgi:aryl-alcohol dehydrogenase-like predicted oxidoreductase